jgi:tryptophan synthase alpha chain
MNLIDQAFARLKEHGQTALIPFITIGDPDLDTSIEIIQQLEAAGADIVELGVPYSDPLADGPVIQRASSRALQHKVTIMDCMAVAKRSRQSGVKLPFILFTYYNPALQLGLERFFDALVEHEISGIIIPDLPIEEDEEVRQLAIKRNIHLVPLVAPTSRDRIQRISARGAGFIYCVSSMGVTGVRSEFFSGIDEFLSTVRGSTSLPIAVGFGISSREHVQQFEAKCDGVIVGSAIVRQIEEVLPKLQSGDSVARTEGLEHIRRFVAGLKGNE